MKRGFVRNLTGVLAAYHKKKLWAKGFNESIQTDSWTREQCVDFHNKKLVAIVRDAYENIPFYREYYKNIKIESFSGINDLPMLPVIDKATLLENTKTLLRPGVNKLSICEHTTGGSTGTIATLVNRRGIASYENGCIFAMWSRIGVRKNHKMLVLRGSLIKGGQLSKYNKRNNSLEVSTYHLNKKNVHEVVDLIENFKPDWFHVYPSAATLLARVMRSAGLELSDKPKGVLCGSEKLYDWQITLFKSCFSEVIYSHYGHGEYVLLGGGCPANRSFHFLPNHGYVEILDNSGDSIQTPWEVGEIVGTGYIDDVMPLIRYKTADFGSWDSDGCCPDCGRWHQRLATIEGRIQEYLVLKDNTRFPVTNINALHGTFFSYIYRFQFVQTSAGKATLKLMPACEITDAKMQEIKDAFSDIIDLGLEIEFEIVEKIALTSGGKERIVINTGAIAGVQ